jgi:hypothetical protein
MGLAAEEVNYSLIFYAFCSLTAKGSTPGARVRLVVDTGQRLEVEMGIDLG